MARELSQGELLDFLCRAGGRVANAALLGHFKGFLRDAAAGPEELRRRRELFKGFVNSVATVQQGAPGAAKYVVLRKRYRDLVGEEPQPEQAPPDGRAPGPGREGLGPRAEEEARPRSRPCPQGEALPPPQANGPPRPVGGMGAPPSGGLGLQQRVREWVAASGHQASLPPDAAGEEGPSARSPCASPPPVFRSIRCQLALQDLDEFLEQESPASEDSSSASGGSDSCRGEAEPQPAPHGCPRSPPGVPWTRGGEELVGPSGRASGLPQGANGLVGPSGRTSGLPQGGPIPGHLSLRGQRTQGSSPEDEPLGRDFKRPSGHLPKAHEVARWPPPNLGAPLSPQLARWQGFANGTPSAEGLGPDADGSPEHRSSLVPLEPREHAWLVKVATGSWLQARALFLEDPHLATRKDFISGYTVLHWLAKHGNAQVLLDFVTGARRAGVALDVNVKSGCGYTPLHLAAMHGHSPVIRLLVQKLQCRVQVRDTSGKRPWQYLSSSTSGEIWQLLGAPKGQTIFLAHPIPRDAAPARRGRSPELARKVTRKTSLAAYLKPQHIKWKMANKYPALQEREEYSD